MRDPEYESEVFRLAVTAAFYHPDLQARTKLRRQCDDLLNQLGETPAEEEVRALIASEKGTTIEPFSITAEDLECAVFLARMAFSGSGGQTRFRIVSRETLGGDGGLVLTQNLKSYYVERYVHAKHRALPTVGWSFVPSLIPTGPIGCASRAGATLYSEDQGFRVVVPLPECASNAAVFARQFQQHGGIQGVRESFSQLGLRVECRDGAVHLLSGSPESMIRIMAHMVEETTLTLKGAADEEDIPNILMRLRMPEDEPVTLPAVAGLTPGYTAWISASAPAPIFLTDEHKLAISDWLRPHPNWISLVFDHLK